MKTIQDFPVETGITNMMCIQKTVCFVLKNHIKALLVIGLQLCHSTLNCDQYSKAFTKRRNLIIHQNNENIHIGVNEFMCGQCNNALTDKSNLIKHKKIYTSVKEFMCGQCNKAFTWRSDLITHQKIHAGVKEHK